MLNGIGRHSVVASRSGDKSFQVRGGIDSTLKSSGSAGFGTTGSATLGNYEKGILDGFVQVNNDKVVRQICRDIYYHDPIAGSAIDLQSEIPFSEFTLSGLPDQEMLKTYAKSVESLNVKMLLPELTREYQVDGAFVGFLNKDDESGAYTSIMPQNLDFCELTPLPIYGRDPLIDLIIPKDVKALYNKGDKRVKDAFDNYGDDLPKMMSKDRISLDPKDVLYIPRRTFSTNSIGMSILRRVLPVWIMEKALLRGSIDLAYRRQRSILQIVAGDEEWEPSNQELTTLVNMVIQADADPTGAVLATRPGINFNEIRSASDFWRYDEMYDFFSGVKMRALGISDAFLSGDSTYSNMETSLSVFIEQIRAFRDMITRKVFYNRLFPLIAVANDFTVEKYVKEKEQDKHKVSSRHNSNVIMGRDGSYMWSSATAVTARRAEDEIDLTKYLLPKLQWHKQLKPEADADYLNVLATVEEKGLPIPMRIWAAAAGLSLPEILTSLDEDINLRKRIDRYNKKKPKSATQEASDLFTGGSALPIKKVRNFDNVDLRMRDPDTHKVLSRKGEKILTEKIHKQVAKALANVARKENAAERRKSSTERRVISYAKAKGISIYGNVAGE